MCLPSATAVAQNADSTRTVLRRIADRVLKESRFRFVDRKSGRIYQSPADATTATGLVPDSPYTDWRYWNGVLNLALIRLDSTLHIREYGDFPRKNAAFCFDNYRYFEKTYRGEGKWNYPFGQMFMMEELDDCGAMGASLIEIFRTNQEKRYRDYIDKAAGHIESIQARLGDGTLVRTFPHRWTLWADDLYMSVPFLARMGELSGDRRYFDDAATQVVNFHKYLFDPAAGCMRHCWYSDVKQPGIAFWGRANGWAMVAQVELLDRLPHDYPKRDTLIALLQRHILGLARYQGGDGLWHQLLDKTDSYPETSCSAMFVYTIARAVTRGYIDPRYASIALRGWDGVMTKIREDGQIEGICTGTGVGNDLVFYYTRPAPLNDVHGIGAVLLAGSEILSLKQK